LNNLINSKQSSGAIHFLQIADVFAEHFG